MVLDSYRHQADRLLLPVARRMTHIHPNVLTWISLAAVVPAAWLIYVGGRSALLGAFGLVLLSSLMDALDGKVARITAKASARGDLLDHTIDRYADVLIIGGVTFSRYCPTFLGFLALVGVMMTSYMGTQAQALGLGRMYAGYLGRADRLVIVLVALLLQGVVDPSGSLALGPPGLAPTFLGWAMLIFALLGNATAASRGLRIWRGLSRAKREG